MRWEWFIKILFFLLLFCFSFATFAEEEVETTFDDDIDATNQYIANQWDQLNRSVDMFFTNKKSKASENKGSIFVYSSFYKKEGESIDSKYDFQLRFDLPHTTKKLKIVIEKQQDEIGNALSDTSVTNNKTIRKDGKIVNKSDTHYTAGANFLLVKSKYFISFFHFGIRLDMPLNPFVKVDLQKKITTKHVNIELSQKVMMYRQEGLQEVSQLSLNRKINKNLQADLINSLVWSEETDDFILRNNFILSQDVGTEKSLSYSLGANARLSPAFYYESYDASVSYRQLLYRDWLYGTFTLGADFPKASDFNDEKFVQFRLDIFFKE